MSEYEIDSTERVVISINRKLVYFGIDHASAYINGTFDGYTVEPGNPFMFGVFENVYYENTLFIYKFKKTGRALAIHTPTELFNIFSYIEGMGPIAEMDTTAGLINDEAGQ